PTDEMEEKLAAGLSKGQIAEFIEDDKVHSREMIGEITLAPVAGLGLEPVDEIDDIVEAAAGAGADAASGNGDGQMGLAGAGPTDQDGIALLGDKAATSKILDQRLVDRRAVELEVVDILGKRQLGDGELVFDRARLLLADFGFEQVADDTRRLVLTFD